MIQYFLFAGGTKWVDKTRIVWGIVAIGVWLILSTHAGSADAEVIETIRSATDMKVMTEMTVLKKCLPYPSLRQYNK